MIKLLAILLLTSCVTYEPAPQEPMPELPKTPTAPKPPVATQRCSGESSFISLPKKDIKAIPQAGYYSFKSTSLVGDKKIAYINYEGRNIKKGFLAGQSFIVCKKSAFMGGANISVERRKLINFYIKGYFKDIGIDIELAESLNSTQMLEMVIGGNYADLGCGRNSGILGVAPFDKGNRRVDEVGFAFVNNNDDNYTIASTIAHEMAHTYGLDHINNKCGVMYYAITDYITGFKEGKIKGGFKRQNSPVVLRKNLK